MSGNTVEGLAQLSQLVRKVRGKKSYRRFAQEAGLSEATIKRIEDSMIKSPSDATFEGLARACKCSPEELRAIAREQNSLQTLRVSTAEDLIPLVNQLSDEQAARLAQYIVARLARMEVSMTDTVQGGLSINVQLMSNSQLGAVLKTIGDRLQRE